MKTWSFYNARTGRFLGRKYSGPNSYAVGAKELARNTPDGFVAIEGDFDRFSQRFDFDARKVVTDRSLTAERNAFEKRQRCLAAIAELERRQARPMRELAIDPNNAEASHRLRQINEQVSQLRAELQAREL
jgi:hypothetical protein